MDRARHGCSLLGRADRDVRRYGLAAAGRDGCGPGGLLRPPRVRACPPGPACGMGARRRDVRRDRTPGRGVRRRRPVRAPPGLADGSGAGRDRVHRSRSRSRGRGRGRGADGRTAAVCLERCLTARRRRVRGAGAHHQDRRRLGVDRGDRRRRCPGAVGGLAGAARTVRAAGAGGSWRPARFPVAAGVDSGSAGTGDRRAPVCGARHRRVRSGHGYDRFPLRARE